MSQYTLTDAELSNLKRRLTYRQNRLKKADTPEKISSEADQVTREVAYAQRIFDEKGYPDCHHDWERAKDDAETLKRLRGKQEGASAW